MSWDSIIGQQRVKDLFRRLYETERLPHALLFSGPEGVGKEAVALELAKVLNCEHGQWNACDRCASCLNMSTLRHPNLKLVFALPSKDDEKTALDKFSEEELEEVNAEIDLKAQDPYHRIRIPKAQGIKIRSIRDIRRESSFRAGGQGRTVVLISDADSMNPNAANALLKTLEEPTGDLILILTTSRRSALLPTIVSRCQQVYFEHLSDDAIRQGLMRDTLASREQADMAARLSQGSYALALDIASEEGLLQRREIREYIAAIVVYNPTSLIAKIQEYTSGGDRQKLIHFLTSVADWFRDVLALQEGATESLRNIDLLDRIKPFHEHYPHVRCVEAIEIIESVIEMIPKNVHLVNLMIVLSQRLRRCIIPPETFA